MGIALCPGHETEAFYFPYGDSPRQLIPHFVTEHSIHMSASVGTGFDSPSATISFDDWPLLSADIEYKGQFFTVRNLSTENWRNLRLDLNGRPSDYRSIAEGWQFGPGFIYTIPFLPAGSTTDIGAFAFAKLTDGEPFNPAREPISDLVLIAQLPDGRFGRYLAR